ncbi:hypothetical protein D6827_03825 [Candidatus Parcubacteria bacterium]|nr:MAG: hypothetical protein D6827_03825 [Candidatus Parcubacteria bacterium]
MIFTNELDFICYALELPWLQNVPFESCIPAGDYLLKRHYSEKFGFTYLLTGVPGRELIVLHPGNSVSDTRGCIMPGLKKQQDQVLESRKALANVLKYIRKIEKVYEEVWIKIRYVAPFIPSDYRFIRYAY